MEKRIPIKWCTRLSWSQFVGLITSCYILIFMFIISPVNCVETKASLNLTTCVLTVNKNVYNLSSLVRNDGDQPWLLNTRMSNDQSQQNVFINLCRPLPSTLPALPNGGCRDSVNSSVCMVNMIENQTTSFGDFNDFKVTFDDSMEAIHFIMKNTNLSTEIYLHCNPSSKNSQPILIKRRSNRFLIEWYDAAACPKADVIGEDCSVYVPSISKVFDLSPLKKPGGYDFPEDGYDYFINVCGPVNATGCSPNSGICHYSKDGKMTYSLGQWNDQVIYSDGIIKLTYGDGDPYRNVERTPRASEILFICNNSAGEGKPDFIKESNRTYIIHWETKYACPKMTHNVDCIWQNSTHRIDLTPFSKSEGNFLVPLKKGFVVINACSPVNPRLHRLPQCPYSSGACFIPTDHEGAATKSRNLGQPKTPPRLLFNNQISLLYTDGDTCPSDPSKPYVTYITFSCDRNVGEGSPSLLSEDDLQNCEWLFEWKTSLVCQPRPIYSHQCIFEDQLNKLKVDLTQVFSSLPPISEQNNSTIKSFFINVCSVGSGKDYKEMTISKMCSNSSLCVEETLIGGNSSPRYLSLGNLQTNNSEYFFQGESLILRFFNGSFCDGDRTWSSEIDIRCSSNRKTTFVRRETDKCIHKIFLESALVCGLKPPSCTYRFNNSIIDLRELSSLTHAWKTNAAPVDKVYYFNLCNKIPKDHHAFDGYSSVVECDLIDGVEHCGHPLGQKDLMTMSMEYDSDQTKQNLVITYAHDKTDVCTHTDSVTTKIKLICSSIYRDPKFTRKVDNFTHCEYHFEWETYLACFDHEPERKERKLIRNGNYFIDKRPDLEINMAINMSEIFHTHHTVTDGKYNYTINLTGKNDNSKGNCKNAAICQREINGTLERDIGSLETEMMVTQGTKMKLKLTANNHQKCGKNARKNVTSTIFFQCSSAESGIGSPRFFYESNDCDYIFIWDTSMVCSGKMLSTDFIAKLEESSVNSESNFFGRNGSSTASLFGAFLLVICVMIFAVGPLAWVAFRLSDREKRNYLVHWIRSKFRAPVITSFHYSQVSSDSTKLVSINDDL
ncbi:cation-independent mannose-6-phosphate receptor-like [Panonychus citri]|uniref:cation-independent mannose-6-phosphate receptor-like n=1 Tax=Panonychus citri TaxID=50023 RepID=UPI0023074BC3|nr:cation-independent mannose-6-phosphate receptor-like [Panonychus citri]